MMNKASLNKLVKGALTCTLLAFAFSGVNVFAEYPERPIRYVVPFKPGGNSDFLARLFAVKLEKELGQPVVVVNKPGASGNIGGAFVATAENDGYTLLSAGMGFITINPSLYDLPYNPMTDLAPITTLVTAPMILMANPATPVDSIQELIEKAKAEPGQLTFATSGIGSPQHMALELLKAQTGIDVLHVPYNSSAEFVPDLLSGRIQLGFFNLVASLPFLESGKLKALGVTSPQRHPQAPTVPTIAESGVSGYQFISWNGVMTTGGTPMEIIDRLHAAFVPVANLPDVRGRLKNAGGTPVTSTPEEMALRIKQDTARWRKIITDNNIKKR